MENSSANFTLFQKLMQFEAYFGQTFAKNTIYCKMCWCTHTRCMPPLALLLATLLTAGQPNMFLLVIW